MRQDCREARQSPIVVFTDSKDSKSDVAEFRGTCADPHMSLESEMLHSFFGKRHASPILPPGYAAPKNRASGSAKNVCFREACKVVGGVAMVARSRTRQPSAPLRPTAIRRGENGVAIGESVQLEYPLWYKWRAFCSGPGPAFGTHHGVQRSVNYEPL